MKKTMWSLFLFFFITAPLIADVTPEDIENALMKDLHHPYLYFTEKEKPALLERIKSNPESNENLRRRIAGADRLLDTPVPEQVPSQGKHDHYLGKNDWGNYMSTTRSAALELAFAYQMTGEEKYAVKAYEFADALCQMPTWVNTYEKFFIIYTRVWPWNCSDDQVLFSFNHQAGTNARSLALVYDWLYPALTKLQRDRIRSGLLENAITRVRDQYDYQWWASAYRCNWCGVCFSGLGAAALTLLTENPEIVDVVAESYNRIGRMLDEIGVDGGWQEGCGYWNYGLYTSIQFADMLKRLTNGKYNLFEHPKLTKNTVNFPLYCHVPPNTSVNFEDSGQYLIGASYTYDKLAAETGSKEAVWYRENLLGKGGSIMDLLWPVSDVEPGLPEQASIHFRTINWAIMRSDFTDPEKVMVACKAGYNDDPHHGHLDCGQFIVCRHGTGYISEMPRASYDAYYFQKERWDYPQASSVGHNVIFVNGELQIPSKIKDQPWKEGIGGEILDFRTTETRDYTLMDPSGAYPGKELKGWRRHIILDKPVVTVVLDEVKSSVGAEIEARFHSASGKGGYGTGTSTVTQVIRDNYLMLDGEKGDMALIPVVDGDFLLRPGKHEWKARLKDAKPQSSTYCDLVLNAESENTVIATIILPVDDEKEAQDIVKSVKYTIDGFGNFMLTFTKTGKIYNYWFKKEPEGLVLE